MICKSMAWEQWTERDLVMPDARAGHSMTSRHGVLNRYVWITHPKLRLRWISGSMISTVAFMTAAVTVLVFWDIASATMDTTVWIVPTHHAQEITATAMT